MTRYEFDRERTLSELSEFGIGFSEGKPGCWFLNARSAFGFRQWHGLSSGIPSLIDLMFGCCHTRLTFPRKHPKLGCDYVCCLTCGKEFEYCMNRMAIQRELPKSYPLSQFSDSYTGNLIGELTEQVERTR